MNLATAASDVLAGCAHVILDVAAAQHAAGIDIFKSSKNFFRSAPGDVNNYVQPAAMAHAHHQFDRALLSGRIENFVHQGNERGDAFERKALVAQIALLQNLLEQISPDEEIEHSLLIHRRLRAFEPVLDPAAARGIRDVHELRSHRAAVDTARLCGKLASQSVDQSEVRGGESREDRGRPPDIPSGGRRRTRVRVLRWVCPIPGQKSRQQFSIGLPYVCY